MISSIQLSASLNGYNYVSILRLNQYDKGVPVRVNLLEKSGSPYTLKTDDVVSIEWALQGKLAYIQTTNIVKGDTYIDFIVDKNTTALSGEGYWNIVITSGEDERIATFRIPLIVESNSVNDDTAKYESIASAIDELRDLLKQAQDQGITGIEVENNLNSDSNVKALAAAQGKELNTKISSILSKISNLGAELINNDGMLYLRSLDGVLLGTGIDISKISNAIAYQTIVGGSTATDKHGIAYNAENTNDKDIVYKNITAANGYGVLSNYGCTNSKRLRISDCKILGASDAIELNHPLDYGDGSKDIFKDAIISNNFIATTEGDDSSTAGFAVGIAQSNNVSVVANVSEYAKVGGLHIEDAQRNIVATGNVFDNCVREGFALYGRTKGLRGGDWYARPVIVTNNHFCAATEGKGTGFYNTFTQYGNLAGSIITNNRFEGFAIGADLQGRASSVLDNNLFQRCTLGIQGVDLGFIGKNYFSECTKLIKPQGGTTIAGIIAVDAVEDVMKTVITSSLGSGSATIKELAWYCPEVAFGSEAVTIPLIRAPYYMEGILKVCFRTSGGHYYRWLGKVSLIDGTFKMSQIDMMMKGAFSSIGIKYDAGDDNSFGKIYLGFTSEVGEVTYYTNIHFEGTTVWKKGTDNQEASVV